MKTLSIFVVVLFAMVAGVAQAHSGGLDGKRCHHDRKNGGYHCH
ncbi:YHYH domain-containing protein [Candidatus Accumulibacter sp. ACC007]|nr:YHYH domain-containing protein [Candidatus Accumulibacter sp. ACC007]